MCRATASTKAGSQSKSGNPCDRLMAPVSAASFDMTVKIVVPTEGSFDFRPGSFATPSDIFKHSRRRILPDLVPREVPAVHGDVDARRQDLHERQRAAQVEQEIGRASCRERV